MAMSMSRTMNDLHAPKSTWADDVQAYTHSKRRCVDEGLVQGQTMRIPNGHVQTQERAFDPLLQRFRDHGTESHQRLAEEHARIAHLNRAKDIQIMREQPFHIVNHESKLEVLAPGADPMRLGGHGTLGEKPRCKDGRGSYPQTAYDHNIISNLPMQEHHWGPSHERPPHKEKNPLPRKVPGFLVKDFDIVTNKYVNDHDQKMARDKKLNILEATHKHNTRNRFDPVTQQFSDPQHEERCRAVDHAREVEIVSRADAQIPPAFKGRQSAHYDMLSHEVHNPEMIKLWDTAEAERKAQRKNRYIVEHNLHAQDLKGDHMMHARRLNRIAPERFEEQKRRGYDILDNKAYGRAHHDKHFHESFTKCRLTPWEKVCEGRGEEPLAMSSSAAAVLDTTQKPRGMSNSAKQLNPSRSSPSVSSSQRQSGLRRSESVGAPRHAAAAPPGFTRPPGALLPPPPSIPGDDKGSVYSRASGRS